MKRKLVSWEIEIPWNFNQFLLKFQRELMKSFGHTYTEEQIDDYSSTLEFPILHTKKRLILGIKIPKTIIHDASFGDFEFPEQEFEFQNNDPFKQYD